LHVSMFVVDKKSKEATFGIGFATLGSSRNISFMTSREMV